MLPKSIVCSAVVLATSVCLIIRGPHGARADDATPTAVAAPSASRVAVVDLVKRAEEVKNLKFAMFVCWSLSTFSDKEWTSGSIPISTFNPTGCDTDQWARTAKAAGMNSILFLTKHCDGFCFWDTQTTDRKVTKSPLGVDVLAEVRKSCDKYGLKLGLYYCEGDFTWPGAVDGSSGGNNPEMKKAQLRELLTNYGVIDYMFMDCGIGVGGLSDPETNAYIKSIQPGCIAAIVGGEMEDRNNKPAGPATPGYPNVLLCDVSQPLLGLYDRWFYTNPGRDNEVRPAEEIFKLYQDCVQHRNLLLLDVGPDRSGRLRKIDVETLEKVGKMIRISAVPATSADLYVASDGKDTNPGTAAEPFATVARARDAVRKLAAAGLDHDVVVLIRGGVYPQTETLVFGPDDSGTQKYSITYVAAPGEKVVLSGGRTITGWKKGEGEIWTAELPEVKAGKWYFRQLFIDGQRTVRARTPNGGVGEWPLGLNIKPDANNRDAHDTTITLGVDQPIIKAWRNITDVEVIWLCNNAATRKRLGSVNETDNTFTLPPPHMWPHGFTGEYNISFPDRNFGCYFENALEMLDQPGEWYLDRQTGVLSYWPREGEDLTKAEVVAPLVQNTLLAVQGTRDRPVQNLHFQGIRVAYVDWPLPPYGFTGLFGCLQLVEQNEPKGSWKMYWIDAAVSFKYARSCNFIGGAVEHTGGIGISMLKGCAGNVIEGNDIHDLGGGGITAGVIRNRNTWQWADPLDQDDHKNYRIANNHIHECGMDYYDAVGIFISLTQEAVVAHNLIHDIAYTGIVVNGNETPESPYLAKNNTVEYNHIYHVMQVAADGAAIYVSFPQADRGAIIRGNLIHDTGNGLGIYLDTVGMPHGCAGYHFEDNIVYHSTYPMSRGARNSMDNRCIDNLISKGDGPAAEFIKAFQMQAGLDPAYRRLLLGSGEPPCQFYPLTEGSRAMNVWSAWQFHWSERDEGVVQVFRRSESREDFQHIKLQSLDTDARYEVKNLGTETTSQHTGRELIEQGFSVTLADPSPTNLEDDNWHHIAVTHDGKGIQTYVDGVEVGVFVPMSPGSASTNSADFSIGASVPLGRHFKGTIDEVAVFNTALSKEAILFIKNNGVADYDPNASLVGFWDFEEITGVIAHDKTVNHNHGTLNNFDFDSGSVSDRLGNPSGALRFDGANQFVNCGNDASLDVTNTITILAWVKPDGVQVAFSTVVGKEVLSSGGYTLMIDGSAVLSYMCNGGSWVKSGDQDDFSLEPISTTTIVYQRIQTP